MNTIICAAFNNKELTNLTYESLVASSREPYRLIFVNNGSTDGTKEWIDARSPAAGYSDNTFVNNPENKGCGIGRNVGARLVKPESDYITFVDNDIVATAGWDTEMIRFMEAHPEVGICGPMTNFAGTPQLLDKTKFKLPETVDEVEPFAKEFKRMNQGKWSYVPNGFVIIGFCMMIRKSCYDMLKYPDDALFDEKFKYYGKEDNDLCLRATKAGWKLAYFGGCYVHHWGSKSLDELAKAGIDWGKEWRENDKVFAEKWGPK